MANEDDFQGAIAYLGCDLSQYVTGQNLFADGGFTSWSGSHPRILWSYAKVSLHGVVIERANMKICLCSVLPVEGMNEKPYRLRF